MNNRAVAPDNRARRIALAALPLVVGAVIALLPAPDGLPQYAWYYLAIFAAVIAGLVVEPIPSAAIGLVGVAAAATAASMLGVTSQATTSPAYGAAR